MSALPSENPAGSPARRAGAHDLEAESTRADAHQKDQPDSRDPVPLRAAAFFDLDRTLMAGSSGIFFAVRPLRRG